MGDREFGIHLIWEKSEVKEFGYVFPAIYMIFSEKLERKSLRVIIDMYKTNIVKRLFLIHRVESENGQTMVRTCLIFSLLLFILRTELCLLL